MVRFTRSSLRPTLVVFGFFASSGLSGHQIIADPAGGPPIVIPGGITQAFRQVGRLAYPEYAAGFTLTIPIKNRSAQADNIRARLEERQLETSTQQTRARIDLEVRNAMIGLMQTKARVEAAPKKAMASVGRTSYSNPDISRVTANAPAMPSATPMDIMIVARRNTIQITSRLVAPRAIRTPISCLCWPTKFAKTP